MTFTTIPLGNSPSHGYEGANEAVKFKLLMRKAIGSEGQAWLIATEAEDRQRAISICFYPTNPLAAAWARKAQAAAPNIWDEVARVEKELVR